MRGVTHYGMVFDDSDIDSLQREVKYLRSSQLELCREHREEIKAKDESLHKRLQRMEQAEKKAVNLKRARYDLEEQLRFLNDQLEESGLEAAHLKRELQRAREQNRAAKLRIESLETDLEEASRTNPSTDLRRKIKKMCVKYHPDHGLTKVCSAEVARDLIDLLD